MDKKYNTEWRNNKYKSIFPWCAKSVGYKDQLRINGAPIIDYMKILYLILMNCESQQIISNTKSTVNIIQSN